MGNTENSSMMDGSRVLTLTEFCDEGMPTNPNVIPLSEKYKMLDVPSFNTVAELETKVKNNQYQKGDSDECTTPLSQKDANDKRSVEIRADELSKFAGARSSSASRGKTSKKKKMRSKHNNSSRNKSVGGGSKISRIAESQDSKTANDQKVNDSSDGSSIEVIEPIREKNETNDI